MEELFKRANWLSNQLLKDPSEVYVPKVLGRFYGGQWLIYSYAMYTKGLSGLAKHGEKELCISRIDHIIQLMQTDKVMEYDTMNFGEKPNLTSSKSHMTYLSLLGWALSNYKLAGGDEKYDELFKNICENLHKKMLRRKNLCLPSFKNGMVFLPDFLVTIVCLVNYGKLFDDRYQATVDKFIDFCREKFCTGGILQSILGKNRTRGSYSALNCYYLTLIDPVFAKEQYDAVKKKFRKDSILGTGLKEYAKASPLFKLDHDAGPIINGMSPSGTTFIVGSAAYFNDTEFLEKLLKTADRIGRTTKDKDTVHYKLGEWAIVGEATMLAMRTNEKDI